jgi:hypothetical protein
LRFKDFGVSKDKGFVVSRNQCSWVLRFIRIRVRFQGYDFLRFRGIKFLRFYGFRVSWF